MSGVLLGYEIGSGSAVHVPRLHTVACGMTQSAGKTTALDALITRSNSRAIAFVTKRSESGFADAHGIPPFFTDRADWQFVESIIEATMRQRMKLERAWIIRACEGATSLADVQRNIRTAIDGVQEVKNGRSTGKWKKRPAAGLSGDVYLQLEEYLKIVVPEMQRLRMEMPARQARLELAPGISVMRLEAFSTEMQSLVIASVLDQVYAMHGEVTAIVPEAWEFCPEGRNTPVKLSAISFIRKGLGGGKLLYIDSQDVTSVDKKLLKQVGLWILGVQREINEVEHTIAQVPLPKAQKPKPEDVMKLKRGEFFVCYEGLVKRTYVCPAGVPESLAVAYAKSGTTVDFNAIREWMKRDEERKTAERKKRLAGVIGRSAVVVVDEERTVTSHVEDEMDARLAAENTQLKQLVADLKQQVALLRQALERLPQLTNAPPANTTYAGKTALGMTPPTPRQPSGGVGHDPSAFRSADPAHDELYAEIKSRLLQDPGVLLAVRALVPELEIQVKRHVIAAAEDSLRGRIGMLIHGDFFGEERTSNAVCAELSKRGYKHDRRNVYKTLDELTEMGFFRKHRVGEGVQFVLMQDMKVRVLETEAA